MTNITEDIKYIGVNDREIDLFEGQYEVLNGMAYNSYVILDEKVAAWTRWTGTAPPHGSKFSNRRSPAGSPLSS